MRRAAAFTIVQNEPVFLPLWLDLVAGFACAIENGSPFTAEAFNLVDGHVDERIVDVQAFVSERWPEVPNFSRGNESLLSVQKARTLLGYEPIRGGSYFPVSLVW